MVLLLTDLDPVTAFSAVVASVHCTGPGLGALGASVQLRGAYGLSDLGLHPGYVAGRLEILSFMALLTPAFWRR